MKKKRWKVLFMLTLVPDYYDRFRCLAGACPHSCCEQWEVVIDDAHVDLYQQVTGPLGEKLRGALQSDAEGDLCFALNGGRCPFLDGENLCEIHRRLGEEATSITCQEHPRFIEDYGPFREVTLSASCPAANELLLGSEAPLTFCAREDADAGEEGDPWLPHLLALRQKRLEILADRTRPLQQRLDHFLALAEAAQPLLDEDAAEELPALAAEFEGGCGVQTPVCCGLEALSALEVLEPDWPAVLQAAESVSVQPQSEPLLERIAVYFAFRYLLKTVNDGDLLSRAQFVVYAVRAVERLAVVCGLSEALRRFSAEVEHSDENLETLLETLRWGPAD